MYYVPNKEAIKSLSFSKNPAWDVAMEVLNVMIQQEVANVISPDLTPEKRAHAAGRADSLVDYSNYLAEMRKEALETHRPSVD